jgi:riboflavin kinase / FMN adenylyltransferase
MIIVHPHEPVPEALRGGVVAIGSFDGLHRGHQVILELARKRALDLSCPVIALTFSPHPRRFFSPGSPPFFLTPGDYQFERMATAKIDGVVAMRFDRDMAGHTPEAFIQEILRDQLNARHVVVGHDFHFGHDRAGNPGTIMNCGIPVTAVDLMRDARGEPYSSTRIRQALQIGDISTANRLLGYTWEVRGEVIHGDRRGHELGYPTANVALHETLHPSYGVYAAHVQIEGEPIWRRAAINIGIRPMFEVKTALMEAHILDFNADIYGRILRVIPVRKLRDEARFADIAGLVRQIERDCEQAARILQTSLIAA